MKSLNTLQLDDVMKHIIDFQGAFPCDQIPKSMKVPYCIIVNTDNANESGDHWTCIRVEKVKAYFIDSFGRDFEDSTFPKDFRKSVRKLFKDKSIIQNNKLLQDLTSNACGYYCVYFLDKLSLNYTFKNIVSDFTKDLKFNDLLVLKYFRKNFL